MNEFGKLLRTFRLQTKNPGAPLTQGQLGELLGVELGTRGYSAAAVSDWERGVSKIHADNREILIGIIKILHTHGGIKILTEANQLLEAGNYRTLNDAEKSRIFPENPDEMENESTPPIPGSDKWGPLLFLERLFIGSDAELRIMLSKAEDGPPPVWPRVLAAWLRRITDRVSVSFALRAIVWVWIWLFTWLTITPSLRWPFSTRAQALTGIGLYVTASLAVPLLIGLLVNTKDDPFWKNLNLARSITTRLYVYQGAGIGFNLGYFFVFGISLAGYYLHLHFPFWLELITAATPLIMGNMAARVIPHNLWLAYKRLSLADGWLFFIVALLGPMWGYFFMQYYSVLLAPSLGVFVILLALTAFIIIETYRAKRGEKKTNLP
ncbi:MAG: helix-turn-helix transcriptional regulator [Chloroflexi bacterium]|nr:helix-turn-helix transcriptional regulator [Chloroflexota bacterium]